MAACLCQCGIPWAEREDLLMSETGMLSEHATLEACVCREVLTTRPCSGPDLSWLCSLVLAAHRQVTPGT